VAVAGPVVEAVRNAVGALPKKRQRTSGRQGWWWGRRTPCLPSLIPISVGQRRNDEGWVAGGMAEHR
jgi:hypothetical protein